MEHTRIRAIYEAAARLFLQQGYAGTQISQIAGAVGVSVGTIYHDFAGKQEIMHFVLKATIEPELLERELPRPIDDRQFAGLDGEISEAFERSGRAFAAHLETQARDYSFAALVSDAFDCLARYAVGCLFIEKNQFEFPELASRYRAYRRRFFETMTQYVRLFIGQGTVRPLAHPELSVNLMIELLSWWAMDMRYIPFEGPDVPLELAKEVCMDNLIAAYGQ